jgi:hypothetical protein
MTSSVMVNCSASAFFLLPFPLFPYPLHSMNSYTPPIVDVPKLEPLVEPPRGIEALDMNAQRLGGRPQFVTPDFEQEKRSSGEGLV